VEGETGSPVPVVPSPIACRPSSLAWPGMVDRRWRPRRSRPAP